AGTLGPLPTSWTRGGRQTPLRPVASYLAVSGGRSVEPGARPDEAYEQERTIKAEQNGACDDHIPKLCPILEAERASQHGVRQHTTSSAMTRRLSRHSRESQGWQPRTGGCRSCRPRRPAPGWLRFQPTRAIVTGLRRRGVMRSIDPPPLTLVAMAANGGRMRQTADEIHALSGGIVATGGVIHKSCGASAASATASMARRRSAMRWYLAIFLA